MTTIVFSSFKGGVGKTTVGILVANAIAASGRRVLVIDLDHQMNTTNYYRLGQPQAEETEISRAIVHNDLTAGTAPSQIINVDIVACSFRILEHVNKPPRTIGDLLFGVEDSYDACIIDCPLTVNNLVVGAWQAADRIVTPVHLDSFDLTGVQYFREFLRRSAPGATERWSVVENYHEPPRKTDQHSLDLQYDEAFRRMIPNLTDIRIPRRAAIMKAIHDTKGISTARTTETVYNAVVTLASHAMAESIEPHQGYF